MLIDTSAWIEYLRATGSPAHFAVRDLIRDGADIATCDPVVMEVLAGGRSESHVEQLRRLLARAETVRTVTGDWEDAAQIYRSGRRKGITVRKLVDCLIAAIALRADESVLHDDVDFDAIAQIVPLHTVRV